MPYLAALLLLPLATPPLTWRIGAVDYAFAPDTGQLRATDGGASVTLLDGAGPKLPQPARLVRVDGAVCHYAAGEYTYTLTLRPEAGALALHWQSQQAVERMTAGRAVGAGPWARLSYTRHAEPYGQPFWPRVAQWRDSGLFLAAAWDMAASAGSEWDAPDQRFAGTGPFATALDVVYRARTDGSRLPLDETLRVRVGRDLWQTAPLPTQQPSPYAAELGREVMLDLWSGTARENTALLRHLDSVCGGEARFVTVLENWQAGGFDALLPDSIRLPEYPPNPGVGSVAELSELCQTAKRLGRFGFRTNYVYLRPSSPSAKAGEARAALGSDGKPLWFTRPADWLPLARRQEADIATLGAPNATFSDQLTSGGGAWAYEDCDVAQGDRVSMGRALAAQRELATLLRTAHGGPLGSETLIDEQLLGQWVDNGDFGIYDGHHRAMTPEFKLRRIHHLSAFHGMGLMYRFFEMPPFKSWSGGQARYLTDPAQYDDYRAATVLYGNGGYLFYYPGMPWDYVLTECLVVGTLQRHYAGVAVKAVRYWHEGRWVGLLDLVAAGIDPVPSPWGPQPDSLRRIRVEYANGLTVVVNRLPDSCTVDAVGGPLTLPQAGWAAWQADGSVLAYSALAPGTTTRIDYVADRARGLRFVNPRGAQVFGVDRPTLWRGGRLWSQVDPKTGDAVVDGQPLPWRPPATPAVTRLDFRFEHDSAGWVGQSDLGPLRLAGGRLCAEITGPDPYLIGPKLDLAPDSVKTVVLRLKVSCGDFGQFYFVTAAQPGWSEERCLRVPLRHTEQVQEVRLPVGDHAQWRGQRITGLRLDPEHGAAPGVVEIESIRGE